MNKVISAYPKGLVLRWEKSFGSEHVMGRSQIEKKIIALVKDFSNKVYLKVKRKYGKKSCFQLIDHSHQSFLFSVLACPGNISLFEFQYPLKARGGSG